MEQKEQQLKVQKDSVADIVIELGTYKAHLSECKIFANGKDEDDVVFIAQDVNDPNNKIQVTIKRSK